MASVSEPKPAGTYHEGRPNQVLRLTPMVPMMAVCTDSDGKEITLIVWVFGKLKDGGVGVFLGADPQQVRDMVRVPSKTLVDNVRAKMDEKGYVVGGELVLLNMNGGFPEMTAQPQIDSSVFDDTSDSTKED